MPFFKSRVEGGLPYLNQYTDFSGGSLARAAAPQRGGMMRRMRDSGINPNDPAYQANLTDFDANLSRSFDDQLLEGLKLDETTRRAAAEGLFNYGATDPLAYYNLLAQLKTA